MTSFEQKKPIIYYNIHIYYTLFVFGNNVNWLTSLKAQYVRFIARDVIIIKQQQQRHWVEG